MIIMDEYFIEQVEDKFVVKKWVDKDNPKVEIVHAFDTHFEAIIYLRNMSELRIKEAMREARNENL